MSQSAPGWYQDHDDPRLARWWDGERWTEHTLVLAEQDWSTEPAPPTDAATRFPVDPAQETVVESAPPARYEEDIYAPIRDPWGDEPEEAPADPATTAWTDSDLEWSGLAGGAAGAGVGTAAAAEAGQLSTGWDDDRWPAGSQRPRQGLAGSVQSWPSWARVAVPLAVVVVIVVAIAAVSGAFSGDDGGVKADDTTSTTQPSLSDAADAALNAAGTGPFTSATFTTLIQAACEAAEQNDPASLTQRITLLGYDADTISKLVDGLEAGTGKYCPDDMADAPTLLNQVRTDALGGTTTSSSVPISIPGDVTSTTVRSTTTTKKPTTSTTKKPTTSTTAATTTSTASTTTSTSTTSTSTTSTTSTTLGP